MIRLDYTLLLVAVCGGGLREQATAFALGSHQFGASGNRRSRPIYRRRASSETVLDDNTTNKEQNEPLRLYILEGGLCPYAARTWITMLELGLSHQLVEVNAIQKQPWFLEINPRGKVPAIQNPNDGTVIYESAICDEYLVDYARQMDDTTRDNSPSPITSKEFWKLMPVGAAEKAAMRLINNHVDTQLGPAQYTYLMNDDKEKDEELRKNLEDALEVLQEALLARGGPYLMGTEFTLAEAHVLPFFLRLVVSLDHFKDYQIPSERFAPLLEWYDLCSQRESVQAAGKSREKIIEVYQKFVDMKYAFGGLNKNK